MHKIFFIRYFDLSIRNNNTNEMKTSEQYFEKRIEKMKSTLLGLALATPALVITVIEILSQTL